MNVGDKNPKSEPRPFQSPDRKGGVKNRYFGF